jgi:hypothetical protein
MVVASVEDNASSVSSHDLDVLHDWGLGGVILVRQNVVNCNLLLL